MTFEALVDRLTSLFDATQTRAVDVVNERLNRMVSESESLQAIVSLGTTTAGTASYSLPSNVVNVIRVLIGTQPYEGAATLEEFQDIDAGVADTDGYFYAILPDADSDENTASLRFYPAPSTTGDTISALVALQSSTLTYTSGTALPIPADTHSHLLAGAEAELHDEEGRQDESAKKEAVYQAGIQILKRRVKDRAKGTGHHRMRVRGYDFSQHSSPYLGC